MPRLLDSLLDFLETPMSLGALFRQPRRLAMILALGMVAEAIAEYRRHTSGVLWPTGAR
jgi:hypothetical protein